MIISHKHRYLFIELPHTASTAISKELCEHYDGKTILWKHALYEDFLKSANQDEKKYFVFSGVRNPLDEAVSIYLKYKSNHKEKYTNPKLLRKNGGHITEAQVAIYKFIIENDADFASYLKKYFSYPYDNFSCLSHMKFNFVYKFEDLQSGFTQALQQIGIEPIRPLPQVNTTKNKDDQNYLTYFPPEVQEHAVRIFGPYMNKWGYDLPANWSIQSVPASSILLYQLLEPFRKLVWNQRSRTQYRRRIKSGSLVTR